MSRIVNRAVVILIALMCANSYPSDVSAENSVLSLLWDGGIASTQFGDKSTAVRFGYDYEKPAGQKFAWKASAAAPVVIYDPKRRKVVNEESIIGAWTHGGRNYKRPNSARAPWTDAYEALATLDKNRDYSVSGRELQVVSLWFDRNRDGQAQAAEVVTAASVGLAEIAMRGQPQLLPDGSKYYRQGFRRFRLTGELFTGSSIAWSIQRLDKKPTVTPTPIVSVPTASSIPAVPATQSVPTASPTAIVAATETATSTATATSTPTPTETPTPTLIEPTTPPSPIPTDIAEASPTPDTGREESTTGVVATTSNERPKIAVSPFNGYWRWVNDFDAETGSGQIHIEVFEDGSVRGTSVAPVEQEPQRDPINSARVVSLIGQVTGERGEEISFKMLVPDPKQVTSCVAVIEEQDGKTFLKGSSVSHVLDSDGVRREVSYEWLAVRAP